MGEIVVEGVAPLDRAAEEGSFTDVDRYLARCASGRVLLDALVVGDSPRVAGEDPEHVRALAEADGPLPAIVVHRPTMRVVDGLHRVRAARLRDERMIDVLFFDGTADEAFLLTVRLNAAHGLPLSQADRNAAARRIITTHGAWSDRAIAAVVGLSAKTVGVLRRAVPAGGAPARIGRDGRVRPLTTAEGRRQAGKLLVSQPGASLREVARRANVSVGTVRDVRRRLRDGADPVPARQRLAEHAEAPVRPVGEPRPAPDLGLLKRDPSMRFSEIGRGVLRVLEVGTFSPDQWQRYTDMVPAHAVGVLADAAHHCAESWALFARKLEERARRTSDAPDTSTAL
ncbi:streptomycin biosynthesis protein [Lentzea sp. BCCO 10_0798]|uniref:Streptomycin biosynthesis protein n=1 Tax=Lentzea kristufekii TaxID=3095430 RepID=A0ABU4TS78_9PSEU|nr:streptomycin biosynthesis protein [Lentzea sp. BCCO 10_0798]MDX8050909.1 streptomycin biosynthesis protein [Lentzea sp. BCCO 10_0798]